MARTVGRLAACRTTRGDCSEWDVETPAGPARAIAYRSLVGPLAAGDTVLLNTTAVELDLGTGGAHFVIARLGDAAAEAFPGRESGHILKLRYTPLQHRVLCVEDEASPHRQAMEGFRSLRGLPVVAAELHSMGAAAAIAARAANPRARIAWLHVGGAALPLSLSRLVARLREDGVLTATLSAGQAFGGDYEAVSVYSALVAAQRVARADLVIAAQGPGNAGTGTAYGFSGLELAEVLHAADALGGLPVLAPRMSQADPRERHRGVSHHTAALLRVLRVPVTVPFPAPAPRSARGHHYPRCDEPRAFGALARHEELLRTMGRGLADDPLFFQAAAGAGWWAAVHPRERRRKRP
jgi:hypothetical protein